MMIEIKLQGRTRIVREVPSADMASFTQDFLHRNGGEWVLIGGTAIPVAKIEFIKPVPTQGDDLLAKKQTIGFKTST